MNITQLGVLYAVIGVGCAGALLARRGRQTSALDLVLVLLVWPLYGPFVLARGMEEEGAFERAVSPDEEHHDVLEALRRAGGAPLAALLPDVSTGRQLSQRLDVATRRVQEIDALLAREQYSEPLALARQRQLHESGDERAAAMIGNRLHIIARLQKMRAHCDREINQISELLTQLRIQAEVVRIAGASDDGTRELVGELVARIQGLDEMLDDEVLQGVY